MSAISMPITFIPTIWATKMMADVLEALLTDKDVHTWTPWPAADQPGEEPRNWQNDSSGELPYDWDFCPTSPMANMSSSGEPCRSQAKSLGPASARVQSCPTSTARP